MPYVTKGFLICDRCGESVEVEEGFNVGLDIRLIDGWHCVESDRFLCPKCYPGYELMLARHKVEIEDYFSKTDN